MSTLEIDDEKYAEESQTTTRTEQVKAEIVAPHEMLARFDGINLCAPMVRYSKLPFRELVSRYDCHITTTPMILAKEFSRSAIARQSDFTTSRSERGEFWVKERLNGVHPTSGKEIRVRGSLVAQFAASDPVHFADATELIWPHVDGVDLNCGCPQTWAYKERIGSFLLRQPDTVRDMIRTARGRVGQNYPISIKIRVDSDPKRTEQLIQTSIHAGVSHIAVHGRTRHQPSTAPVSLPHIAFAVESAKGEVPIVANGDAWSSLETEHIREFTGAQGVMSARGLLANPGMFSGHGMTPLSAIREFIQLSTAYGLSYGLLHRHLQFMLEGRLSKYERTLFSQLPSFASVLDYLESRGFKTRPTDSVPIYTI